MASHAAEGPKTLRVLVAACSRRTASGPLECFRRASVSIRGPAPRSRPTPWRAVFAERHAALRTLRRSALRCVGHAGPCSGWAAAGGALTRRFGVIIITRLACTVRRVARRSAQPPHMRRAETGGRARLELPPDVALLPAGRARQVQVPRAGGAASSGIVIIAVDPPPAVALCPPQPPVIRRRQAVRNQLSADVRPSRTSLCAIASAPLCCATDPPPSPARPPPARLRPPPARLRPPPAHLPSPASHSHTTAAYTPALPSPRCLCAAARRRSSESWCCCACAPRLGVTPADARSGDGACGKTSLLNVFTRG